MLQIDGSEVDALALRWAVAPVRAMAAIVPVAANAGNKIKADMRRGATGHYRLGQLPYTIDYDLDAGPTEVRVDVGFNLGGQGSLAGIVVLGTADTPPIMDYTAPLHKEVPAFMRWIARVGAEAL